MHVVATVFEAAVLDVDLGNRGDAGDNALESRAVVRIFLGHCCAHTASSSKGRQRAFYRTQKAAWEFHKRLKAGRPPADHASLAPLLVRQVVSAASRSESI